MGEETNRIIFIGEHGRYKMKFRHMMEKRGKEASRWEVDEEARMKDLRGIQKAERH